MPILLLSPVYLSIISFIVSDLIIYGTSLYLFLLFNKKLNKKKKAVTFFYK
jgi:hypothetical protein